MRHSLRSARLPLVVAAVLSAAACRAKAPAGVDSSLSRDLALAQRPGVTPIEFNDAPVAGSAPASRAPAAATRRPEPPRADAPTPRPSPRRDAPPAPIARSPDRTPPQPVATAPATAPAPAPEPAPGLIGAGARIGMSTNARVCTNALLVGDKLSATVTNGTVGSNGAAIPVGSTVVLEVASVDRADPIESSHIDFRVRAVEVNGESVPATGDIATLGTLERVQTSSGNDVKKVAGGAIAGAVLGRIFGRSTKATVIGAAAGAAAGTVAARNSQGSDACLPSGSPLRLTLSRDVVARRSGAL